MMPKLLQALRPMRHSGFTLIEVMITVAIIGILASFVIPQYRQYVQRGQRADAAAAMMTAQQFMQRLYLANNSYLLPNGAQPQLPANLAVIPADAARPRYRITVQATATGYTLTARPEGSMANDKCGNLTINQRNARTVSGTGMTVAECFR